MGRTLADPSSVVVNNRVWSTVRVLREATARTTTKASDRTSIRYDITGTTDGDPPPPSYSTSVTPASVNRARPVISIRIVLRPYDSHLPFSDIKGDRTDSEVLPTHCSRVRHLNCPDRKTITEPLRILIHTHTKTLRSSSHSHKAKPLPIPSRIWRENARQP